MADERLYGPCQHFTGIQHEMCRAGVAYASVRDESARPFKFPCLEGSTATTCDKRVLSTKVEKDAEEAEWLGRFANIDKARQAIIAHAGKKRGITGKIACPVCGVDGALKFSIAGYNGHIHAACETADCVRWME